MACRNVLAIAPNLAPHPRHTRSRLAPPMRREAYRNRCRTETPRRWPGRRKRMKSRVSLRAGNTVWCANIGRVKMSVNETTTVLPQALQEVKIALPTARDRGLSLSHDALVPAPFALFSGRSAGADGRLWHRCAPRYGANTGPRSRFHDPYGARSGAAASADPARRGTARDQGRVSE